MTKHYFNKPITSLLSAFIFLTFCNAQTNTPSPTYKLSELKASVTGQSNLIKTYDGKRIESFKPKNEGWIRNVIESKNGNLLLATRHFGVWSYDGKSFNDYSEPQGIGKRFTERNFRRQSGRFMDCI